MPKIKNWSRNKQSEIQPAWTHDDLRQSVLIEKLENRYGVPYYEAQIRTYVNGEPYYDDLLTADSKSDAKERVVSRLKEKPNGFVLLNVFAGINKEKSRKRIDER